jgi:uncharacterized damage-inducible protein DinB
MNSTAFIKQSLESSTKVAMGLLMDLQDEPITQPTTEGGNHALWILGHLAYSESALFDSFILGKPNRYPEWAKVFGIKSEPTTNADDYPPIDEVVQKLNAVRKDLLAWLDTASETDLDSKSLAPNDFSEKFGTVGQCLTAMLNHVSFHAGQASVIRKSLGRCPLMA